MNTKRPLSQSRRPDVAANLLFRMDNGVKEFHLTAEPVKQQLTPDRTIDLWGFNGSAPGTSQDDPVKPRGRFVYEFTLRQQRQRARWVVCKSAVAVRPKGATKMLEQ